MNDNAKKMPPAHNLEEAVSSGNSLEGYAAMNEGNDSEIARRAYQLYEERGRQHGFHEDDWYRAEKEIRSRKTAQRESETGKAPQRQFAAGSGSHR